MSFDAIDAYKKMYLIRRMEEVIAEKYHEGKMRTPTHLSIGQEAAAVGVCMALGPEDRVISTHRCHAHYLAKGGSVAGLIAELYGKATGCARGVGGSMHLIDESVGFLGTSAIVGSSVSIAVGVALASKLEGSNRRVVAFMGDSALETGQVWEAFNFAALHKLPILFVCENNGLSTQTPRRQRQPFPDPFLRVSEILPSFLQADVNLTRLFEDTRLALANVPAFLQVDTNRWKTHVGPEYDHELGLRFRSKADVDEAMRRDPLRKLRQSLAEPAHKVAEFEHVIEDEIAHAFAAAEVAPWPAASALYQGVLSPEQAVKR